MHKRLLPSLIGRLVWGICNVLSSNVGWSQIPPFVQPVVRPHLSCRLQVALNFLHFDDAVVVEYPSTSSSRVMGRWGLLQDGCAGKDVASDATPEDA